MNLRPKATFGSLILRRLLRYLDATLETDLKPKGSFVGRSCEVTILLEQGDASRLDTTAPITPEDAAFLGYPELRIAQEPSLEQLVSFSESLRGKTTTLHASSKGSFAQHLTSYLTAWGLDVSHISTDPDSEGEEEVVGVDTLTLDTVIHDTVPLAIVTEPSPLSSTAPTPRPAADLAAFVLIDDDVAALRNLLQKVKTEQLYPLNLNGSRKRPSLAAHHRPRSSPQVARIIGTTQQTAPSSPTQVIVHFTSLSNYKVVKDAIQSSLAPYQGSLKIPEIIVIPKPAGPRRFLTALYTAVTKPIVDPFFNPIATSPISPGLHAMSPFFNSGNAPRSPGNRSGNSVRTSSDKSTRLPKDYLVEAPSSLAPSSPLGGNESMEYFSDAVVKLGASPSTGLMIQSPDGQPAGIFFHPKSRNPPSVGMTPAMRRGGDQPSDAPRHRGQSFRAGPQSRERRDEEPIRREPMSIAASIAGLTRYSSQSHANTPEVESPTSTQLKGKGRALPVEDVPPSTLR